MADEHEKRHLSRGQWVFYGFLAVGGFFLITEHWAHLFGYLPFLLLLACPLMHLFHHGGHGGHGSHGSDQEKAASEQQKDQPKDHQSHTTKGES